MNNFQTISEGNLPTFTSGTSYPCEVELGDQAVKRSSYLSNDYWYGYQRSAFSDRELRVKSLPSMMIKEDTNLRSNRKYVIMDDLRGMKLNLPKNPSAGDVISISMLLSDVSKRYQMFSLEIPASGMTIYGNGNRIMGFDENLTCDVHFQDITLEYKNQLEGWVIV
jgi:hypothetical protein